MPPYIKVLGTARAPFRVGGQQVSSKAAITLDLGDPKTRQEFAHHVGIGRAVSLGDVAPATSGSTVKGAVVTPTKGTTARGLDVTSGSVRVSGGTSVNIAATTVAFGAADATNPRVDIVQVVDATGVVSVKAGTAGATPAVPSPDASNTALAAVYVPANATSASWVNDIRPLPVV